MKKKNISSWLFTTAKNAALNYKKKHSREIFEIDENWDSEEDTEKYEAQVKSAEEQFLEDELQKQRLELHEKIFTNLMEKNERWYECYCPCILHGDDSGKSSRINGHST